MRGLVPAAAGADGDVERDRELGRWLAEQAEEGGAMILPETAARSGGTLPLPVATTHRPVEEALRNGRQEARQEIEEELEEQGLIQRRPLRGAAV